MYASKSEAHYAMYLDALLKAKKIRAWEGQVRVPLIVNGAKVCVMVPDFLVTQRDGSQEYHEVKGNPERVWVLKLKLFKALFPDAKYVVIKAKEALNASVLQARGEVETDVRQKRRRGRMLAVAGGQER